MSPITIEGNESVILPSGKQFEHASLKKLDTTRSHETIEITTFHEQMDRNASTKNQNFTIAEALVEIPKGCLENHTT